jgi:hypothetical protein
MEGTVMWKWDFSHTADVVVALLLVAAIVAAVFV